jgi:hypothetical protein
LLTKLNHIFNNNETQIYADSMSVVNRSAAGITFYDKQNIKLQSELRGTGPLADHNWTIAEWEANLTANIGDLTHIRQNFEAELLLYDGDIRARIEGRFRIACWTDGLYYSTRNFPQMVCEPKVCSPLYIDYHAYEFAGIGINVNELVRLGGNYTAPHYRSYQESLGFAAANLFYNDTCESTDNFDYCMPCFNMKVGDPWCKVRCSSADVTSPTKADGALTSGAPKYYKCAAEITEKDHLVTVLNANHATAYSSGLYGDSTVATFYQSQYKLCMQSSADKNPLTNTECLSALHQARGMIGHGTV